MEINENSKNKEAEQTEKIMERNSVLLEQEKEEEYLDLEKRNDTGFLQKVTEYLTNFKESLESKFQIYLPKGLSEHSIEEHDELLEQRGYDSQPDYTFYRERLEVERKFIQTENWKKINLSTNIEVEGFRATQSLIKNIRKFSRMEGKDYDLRALAELKKTNPDFKDNPEKQKCFNEIIKECQEQEMQKISFLKQEMMEEMMMMNG